MHYELCIEKRPQGVTVWRRRPAVASFVRSATHAGECNDGVPPLGLVTLCIIRPFPCCSVRRRTAVSHAVNGGDAVVTISPLQCPTANRRLTCRQRRDAVVTVQRRDAGRHLPRRRRDAGRHIRGRRRDAGRHTLSRRSNENWRALPRPRRPCYPEVLQLVCQQMVNVMAR